VPAGLSKCAPAPLFPQNRLSTNAMHTTRIRTVSGVGDRDFMRIIGLAPDRRWRNHVIAQNLAVFHVIMRSACASKRESCVTTTIAAPRSFGGLMK